MGFGLDEESNPGFEKNALRIQNAALMQTASSLHHLQCLHPVVFATKYWALLSRCKHHKKPLMAKK
ncbi:hypothetical protein WH7805_09729 [Synechococcus sp. WH 7805]|nr:hypothetical protein WH7805_09729 [Synechococcus sp. WH 7805]